MADISSEEASLSSRVKESILLDSQKKQYSTVKRFKIRAKRKINLDITRILCNHLVGEDHTHQHRIFTGIVIMVFGVGVAKFALFFSSAAIHFIGDMIGYFIHATGAVPILEHMLKKPASSTVLEKEEES